MATPAIPLRIFRDNILPGLVKAAGGDEAALIKSVKLTLKQGDEEAEIPVVNEAGETERSYYGNSCDSTTHIP